MSTEPLEGARVPAIAAPTSWTGKALSSWAAFKRSFPRAPAMLLLALLALTLNVATVREESRVSALDEASWINYLIEGSKFNVVTAGELMGQPTLRELCIRGSQVVEWPQCPQGKVDGEKYVFEGAEISNHSPFYFLISGPIARLLRTTPLNLPPDDSLVTWGRVLGSAWLLLGFYLTLRAGELLAVKRRLVVLVLGFMIATPALLHASTIVNPDQTALPSGAAVLVAGLAWERRGRGLWIVALTAIAGAALDPTNAIAILLVIGYFAVRAIQATSEPIDGFRPRLAYLAAIAILLVTALGTNAAWDALDTWLRNQGVIAPGPSVDVTYNPVQAIVSSVKPTLGRALGGRTPISILPPFRDAALPSIRNTDGYRGFAGVASLAAVGLLGAVVFGERRRKQIGALGFATVVALLVSPSLIVLRDWYETTHYYAPVGRYGLCAIPAVALVMAAACQRSAAARVLVGVVGLGLYVCAFLPLL